MLLQLALDVISVRDAKNLLKEVKDAIDIAEEIRITSSGIA